MDTHNYINNANCNCLSVYYYKIIIIIYLNVKKNEMKCK